MKGKNVLGEEKGYFCRKLCLPWKKVKSLGCVWLFVTPWDVACQTPLSVGFSRQEYWSGLPFPSPGDLPDPKIEPGSPALQADSSPSEPPGKPCYHKPEYLCILVKNVSLIRLAPETPSAHNLPSWSGPGYPKTGPQNSPWWNLEEKSKKLWSKQFWRDCTPSALLSMLRLLYWRLWKDL